MIAFASLPLELSPLKKSTLPYFSSLRSGQRRVNLNCDYPTSVVTQKLKKGKRRSTISCPCAFKLSLAWISYLHVCKFQKSCTLQVEGRSRNLPGRESHEISLLRVNPKAKIAIETNFQQAVKSKIVHRNNEANKMPHFFSLKQKVSLRSKNHAHLLYTKIVLPDLTYFRLNMFRFAYFY